MTTFADLYHPALGNVHISVPNDPTVLSLYESHGWVLSGGGGPDPTPIDLTVGLGDLRYAKLGDIPTPGTATGDALRAAFDAGSKPWLQAVAGAFGFSFTSITTVDSATGLPTAAGVQWPDGTTGTFTGTTDGSNGYTGYTVTWAGGTTKMVTASGITYDTTTGLALGPTTLTVA